MAVPTLAIDEVESRLEGLTDDLDIVLAADAYLRAADADYRAPEEPLAFEGIADDLMDALPDPVGAPFARAAAIYVVARLYGLPTEPRLSEDALDELAGRLDRLEAVAPCGCVAYADGTGDPCPTHHPDRRAD